MRFLRKFRQWMRKDDRLSWREHIMMMHEVQNWEQAIEMYPVLHTTNGIVTAYVANFARPQNIAPIVRSLLACPSVGRIIVSNNNPNCHLERWFHASSDRVIVLQHGTAQSCQQRFEHLAVCSAPYYLILDDDLFLYPHQIEALVASLIKNPSVPHGLFGQRWQDDHFLQGIVQQEGKIDVINRVYACTEAQRMQSLTLADILKKKAIISERALGWCDDIVLSCSTSAKPHIHDVGPLINCPTQGKKGIATWREDDFFTSRATLYWYIQSIQI